MNAVEKLKTILTGRGAESNNMVFMLILSNPPEDGADAARLLMSATADILKECDIDTELVYFETGGIK